METGKTNCFSAEFELLQESLTAKLVRDGEPLSPDSEPFTGPWLSWHCHEDSTSVGGEDHSDLRNGIDKYVSQRHSKGLCFGV